MEGGYIFLFRNNILLFEIGSDVLKCNTIRDYMTGGVCVCVCVILLPYHQVCSISDFCKRNFRIFNSLLTRCQACQRV